MRQMETIEDYLPGVFGLVRHLGRNKDLMAQIAKIVRINWDVKPTTLTCAIIMSLDGNGLKGHRLHEFVKYFFAGLFHPKRDGGNSSDTHGDNWPLRFDGIDVENMLHENATVQLWPTVDVLLSDWYATMGRFSPEATKLTQAILSKMEEENISTDIKTAAAQCSRKDWRNWFGQAFRDMNYADKPSRDHVAFKDAFEKANVTSDPIKDQWVSGPHTFPRGFLEYHHVLSTMLDEICDSSMNDFLTEHMSYSAGFWDLSYNQEICVRRRFGRDF